MDQTWPFSCPKFRYNKILIAVTFYVISLCCVMVDIAALMSTTTSEPNARRLSESHRSFIVPSQVFRNRNNRNTPSVAHIRHKDARSYECLVPSQVLLASPTGKDGREFSRAGNETETPTIESLKGEYRTTGRHEHPKPSSKARKPRGGGGNMQTTSSRDTGPRLSDQNNQIQGNIQEAKRSGRRRRQYKNTQTGNLPDVRWRSIPIEHLRHHPQFRPLPLPETITRLESMEDVRFFRQESWQWDALHEGRCTTSQAVAALGFLEAKAGDRLGVPKGLRRGGRGAYHRLRQPALRSLEEMNAKLCFNNNHNSNHEIDMQGTASGPSAQHKSRLSQSDNNSGVDNPFWSQIDGSPFAAKYMINFTKNERQQRRKLTAAYLQSRPGIEWSIRMIWGNAQESTALLTALNYFWKLDSNVTLEEVGMCGAGLTFNKTSSLNSVPGLIIGATPDAILRHSDGRIEALEVKNHCPFIPNVMSQDGAGRTVASGGHRFRIGWQEFGTKSVLPNYIPQLMMEMLSVGNECRSAIMVRQSATSGSLVMRMHRDDEWIEEMLYWLQRFYTDFVLREVVPPQNFFFESGHARDRARYVRFLDWTKRIESQVELLCHVPSEEVQRTIGTFSESTNFFLD
jgi:hypothetical protein